MRLASLAWTETAGWIYAFVAENRVRYFGITTNVLRTRMDSYRDMYEDRVRKLILGRLVEGHEVEVVGTRRPGVSKVDLEIEERSLITEFNTDWNVRR
ncbi:MAG: hypothetical protein ACREQB_02470 [Candidatus Binataceae bacterium]